MSLRNCPRCGSPAYIKREGRYREPSSHHVECHKCEIRTADYDSPKDAVDDWNAPRHDDWRSDGWPEDVDVLVQWGGRVCVGTRSVFEHKVLIRLNVLSVVWSVPMSECRWKPFPSDGE